MLSKKNHKFKYLPDKNVLLYTYIDWQNTIRNTKLLLFRHTSDFSIINHELSDGAFEGQNRDETEEFLKKNKKLKVIS